MFNIGPSRYCEFFYLFEGQPSLKYEVTIFLGHEDETIFSSQSIFQSSSLLVGPRPGAGPVDIALPPRVPEELKKKLNEFPNNSSNILLVYIKPDCIYIFVFVFQVGRVNG